MQLVGPRSYLINVEGTAYRRNKVDIRPAEVAPPQLSAHTERPSEQSADMGTAEGGHASRGNMEEVVGRPAMSPRLSAPRSLASPPWAVTWCGRHIKPPDRLDL